jgi:CelD/BcsL family acetyltransferase involved in cellulose biosynthesis
MRCEVKVHLYESEALFDDLREEWNELLIGNRGNQIFLTWDWQSIWWESYHPGRIWALVARDDQTGQLLGIAPWFIDDMISGKRVVRTIGCVDVTDYLDVIARTGREQAVYAAFADFLAEHTDQYDEIRLCNVPEQSMALALFPDILRERGFAVDVQLQEVCPVVELPAEWTDYIASLDKKNRHELRRKLRRAAGAAVDWYIVGPDHELNAELGCFMTLMARSSDEKALFLKERQNADFFRNVVFRMAEQGWLQLAFLTVNGEEAAAYLNFDYDDRVLVYNSGNDPAQFRHLSPGITLLARLIEHAIEQGRKEFDFLRGDESYKYDMGGKNVNIYQIAIDHDRDGGAGA